MDLHSNEKCILGRIQKTLLLPGLRVSFILQDYLAFHVFAKDHCSLGDADISPNGEETWLTFST